MEVKDGMPIEVPRDQNDPAQHFQPMLDMYGYDGVLEMVANVLEKNADEDFDPAATRLAAQAVRVAIGILETRHA